jgi:hypothetical protein
MLKMVLITETECFIKGKSQYYRGKRTCTSKGLHCATWQYREIQTFNNSSFPEGTVAAKSFCRDPDGQKGSPWCFTDGLATTWDYCDIPRCSGIYKCTVNVVFSVVPYKLITVVKRPPYGEVYSLQHYLMKCVIDLRPLSVCFLGLIWFLIFGVLTLLLTIYQLYHGDQF